MKNKPLAKIDVSVSREHKHFELQIREAFEGLDVHFGGEYVRLSQGDLPMQLFIFLTNAFIGGIAWDLLKTGISKLWKKFPKAQIVLRDPNAIMFTLKPNGEVITIVIPDRRKDFEHIRTLDDIAEYLEKLSRVSKAWKKTSLSSIGAFLKGSGITKNQITTSGLNAVRYGELYTRYNVKIQNVATYIHPQTALEATKIQYNDILFAGSGETNEEIGKSAVYLCNKEGYAGGDTIIFRPNDNVDGLFLAYQLNVGAARKKISELGQGQSVVHLYPRDLKNVQVAIPPLPEQKCIVAVLETWDKVIQRLAQKIEAKKQVKKKLMQKLLTGKIRLFGFKNKWQRISLNDIGRIISGGTPAKKNGEFWNGTIPWISSSDLVDENIRHVFIHRYITEEAVSESATSVIPAESIVIVSRVGVGKLIVNKVPLCTSQDFQSLVIKDSSKYNPYFVAYQLSIELQKLLLRNQGTSIKGFLKDDLRKLSMHVPEIKEQCAIANVLTTTDEEIERLERKLKLVRDQKIYLLNHLMTGSIRVPDKISKP